MLISCHCDSLVRSYMRSHMVISFEMCTMGYQSISSVQLSKCGKIFIKYLPYSGCNLRRMPIRANAFKNLTPDVIANAFENLNQDVFHDERANAFENRTRQYTL